MNIFFLFALTVILSTSCNSTNSGIPLITADLKPPTIIEVKSGGQNKLIITTEEQAFLAENTVITSPDLVVKNTVTTGNKVEILFFTPQQPGKAYLVEGSLQDEAGNTLTFIAHFYGYNESVPDLVINEIVVKGSGNNPDFIELYARTGGDLGGVTLIQGTQNNMKDRLIFEPGPIKAGEYLTVYCGDFENGSSLTGTNGVISLYAGPDGALLDCLFYTNRTSESDEQYGGFGSSKLQNMVREISGAGGWVITGEQPVPEDGIFSGKSTSTRSISRNSRSLDSNSSTDWHITPTKGKSPGQINTDEVYDG